MAIHIGNASAWKQISDMKVGVGSVWKQAQSVWVGVGGVWKKAWDYLSVNMPNVSLFDVAIAPNNASCVLNINNDGSWTIYEGGSLTNSGTWLVGGTASQIDVYMQYDTGDHLTGGTENTWQNCGTSRQYQLVEAQDNFAQKAFDGTLRFRNASTLEEMDTALVSMDAQVEV